LTKPKLFASRRSAKCRRSHRYGSDDRTRLVIARVCFISPNTSTLPTCSTSQAVFAAMPESQNLAVCWECRLPATSPRRHDVTALRKPAVGQAGPSPGVVDIIAVPVVGRRSAHERVSGPARLEHPVTATQALQVRGGCRTAAAVRNRMVQIATHRLSVAPGNPQPGMHLRQGRGEEVVLSTASTFDDAFRSRHDLPVKTRTCFRNTSRGMPTPATVRPAREGRHT
jgi:hypothetical protein